MQLGHGAGAKHDVWEELEFFSVDFRIHYAINCRWLCKKLCTKREKEMASMFLVSGLLIVLTLLLSLYRVVFGPGVFNRVVAMNMIGTKTIILLLLIGYIFERPFFLDISLLYAMLNFIGTLAFSKYLEKGDLSS